MTTVWVSPSATAFSCLCETCMEAARRSGMLFSEALMVSSVRGSIAAEADGRRCALRLGARDHAAARRAAAGAAPARRAATAARSNRVTLLLVALAFSFAWSIGSHYTGACMGMPYALGAVRAHVALGLMAPLALAGAALASGKVAIMVGRKLIDGTPTRLGEVVIVAVAFGVTAILQPHSHPNLDDPDPRGRRRRRRGRGVGRCALADDRNARGHLGGGASDRRARRLWRREGVRVGDPRRRRPPPRRLPGLVCDGCQRRRPRERGARRAGCAQPRGRGAALRHRARGRRVDHGPAAARPHRLRHRRPRPRHRDRSTVRAGARDPGRGVVRLLHVDEPGAGRRDGWRRDRPRPPHGAHEDARRDRARLGDGAADVLRCSHWQLRSSFGGSAGADALAR